MNWLVVGGIWGLLGVAFGAFGAHGLKDIADAEQLAWWATAAQYHLIHALALVGAGIAERSGCRVRLAGWGLFSGSLIFSGTLYGLGLGAPSWFGAITPIGGLLMMAGWLGLALAGRAPREG